MIKRLFHDSPVYLFRTPGKARSVPFCWPNSVAPRPVVENLATWAVAIVGHPWEIRVCVYVVESGSAVKLRQSSISEGNTARLFQGISSRQTATQPARVHHQLLFSRWVGNHLPPIVAHYHSTAAVKSVVHVCFSAVERQTESLAWYQTGNWCGSWTLHKWGLVIYDAPDHRLKTREGGLCIQRTSRTEEPQECIEPGMKTRRREVNN